jgi:uncharacterized protein YPO0396
MAIEKSYIDMIKERDAKIEALKELLKLSHGSLDSKDKQIAELQGEFEKLQDAYQTLAQEDDKKSNRIKELESGYEELRIAALHAVCKIGGGQAKADLRDAYDKATEYFEALKEQE